MSALLGLVLIALSWFIVSSQNISRAARLIGDIHLLYMVVATALFFTVKKTRDKYLIFQSLYIIAFQIIILSTAYLPSA